jgi:AcrR family transcriptional regulator
MKGFIIANLLKQGSAESKTYHHGDLPNALLNSALEILEQEGSAALSLRAVARKAGVSQAAPYHHFKDKRDLLASIAVAGHARLVASCNSHHKPDESGYNNLLNLGVGYIAFAKDNPNLFRLMFSPELIEIFGDNVNQAFDKAVAVSTELITKSVKAAFDPEVMKDKAEFDRAFTASWSIFHGLANIVVDVQIKTPPTDSDEFGKFIIGIFSVFDSAVLTRV